MTLKNKIKFWYRGLLLTYPYFRVTFRDGGMSRPMTLSEAVSIFEREQCRIWADYDLMRDL